MIRFGIDLERPQVIFYDARVASPVQGLAFDQSFRLMIAVHGIDGGGSSFVELSEIFEISDLCLVLFFGREFRGLGTGTNGQLVKVLTKNTTGAFRAVRFSAVIFFAHRAARSEIRPTVISPAVQTRGL